MKTALTFVIVVLNCYCAMAEDEEPEKTIFPEGLQMVARAKNVERDKFTINYSEVLAERELNQSIIVSATEFIDVVDLMSNAVDAQLEDVEAPDYARDPELLEKGLQPEYVM